MGILGAIPMQRVECREPLVSILERTLVVCGACDFSRRYRAGIPAASPVAGVDPSDRTRAGETAEKAGDRGELLLAG
jgi:hypothetical protein